MSDVKKVQTPKLPPSFFEVLAQEAIMGIMAFELKSHRCIYGNLLAREILDLPIDGDPKRAPDLGLSDLYPEEARGNLRPFSEEIVKREGLTQDVLVRKHQGPPFIADVGVRRIQAAGCDPLLLVMFQDITFQKKLQRELTVKQDEIRKAYTELLEQNRQLRDLDRAKDQFIALTSHELRTPLSAIVATAEVLQLKLYETAEQRDEFVSSIYEQGLHLMELVNDVLDFAKIRAGKMDFYIERKDVRPVLTKLLDGFGNMAEQSRVTLSMDLPETESLCYFDLIRLKEIFNNVLSNAIKYNKKDGGAAHVSVSKVESFVRVTVADTGQGIPAEKTEHVFNEFETIGNVARHHRGTGLGMPISKRLAEGMGGRLTLESEVGVGTRFFIDLPIEKVLAEEHYRSRPDAWGDLVS